MRFLRGLFGLIFRILVIILFGLIYVFTWEPGTKGQITQKKARRIRKLTKVKMKILSAMPKWLLNLLVLDGYKDSLLNRFGNVL